MGLANLKENYTSLKRKDRVDDYGRVSKTIKRFTDRQLYDNEFNSSSLYWNISSKPNAVDTVINRFEGLADLRTVNQFRRINKMFERANRMLSDGQYYIVAFENSQIRKLKHYQAFSRPIGKLIYLGDTLINRVIPKLSLTKKLYFSLREHPNRIISTTECLGRLVSCGFEIQDYQRIGDKTLVVTKKVTNPAFDMEPTYGLFCSLNRVAKDKKMITVRKIRTMHPYSEYLQKYLYDRNGTEDGDKILNDFRVTPWGKWFRKLWIDELPMIWNFLKGEMKLVGVRPLSKHKFETYPEWLQDQRTRFKPGLVPPFYADLPETVEDFYYSEGQYLKEYEEKPIRTDIKYFFKAMYNIFIKQARSA